MHIQDLRRRLETRRETIVAAVTGPPPEGDGRLADMRRAIDDETGTHLHHLAQAAALEAPRLFGAYVQATRAFRLGQGRDGEALGRELRIIADVLRGVDVDGSASFIARSLQAGFEALAAPLAPAENGGELPGLEPQEVDAYEGAVLAGQREIILDTVQSWASRHGVKTALLAIAEVQRRVGEAWVTGRIGVADEHAATGLNDRAMAALLPRTAAARGPRPRGRAILAGVSGDWHGFGLRLAADLLEVAGWEVVYLGASTPTGALVHAVGALEPRLVGLGVTSLSVVAAAREAAWRVREACPGAEIWAGGWAARIAGPALLDVDRVAPLRFDGEVGP
jgi:methanogenic corrinoid protein MtbC1